MKMQGARGREGIKRHRRRSERFPRNERQLFHERIERPFQKSGDRPKPTNRANPREGDGWKATDEEARTKDQAPRLKQGTVQASRTGHPRTSTATTEPVEGSEAPRNHSSEAGATQERAPAQRLPLNTRMTASTSQRRHGATARVRPTHGTRHRQHRKPGPAPPCPGIRSQKENGDRRSHYVITWDKQERHAPSEDAAPQAGQENQTAPTG